MDEVTALVEVIARARGEREHDEIRRQVSQRYMEDRIQAVSDEVRVQAINSRNEELGRGPFPSLTRTNPTYNPQLHQGVQIIIKMSTEVGSNHRSV